MGIPTGDVIILKRKEPRLRDWNSKVVLTEVSSVVSAWKEKNLDYEIETIENAPQRTEDFLEKKRTSITRLKLLVGVPSVALNIKSAWKEKNLDYEIETE